MQWVIAGLILSGLVLTLSGCGYAVIPITETEAQKPGEARVMPSRGDTRQEVRSMLGVPLIDEQSLGVEVYLQSGHVMDIEVLIIIYPIPIPGYWEEASVYTLVVYDEHDVVKDITTEHWSPKHSTYKDFWIKAGEFSFVNVVEGEPDTLLGPPISWKDLARMKVPEGGCSLVLVMGDCPMEQVLLDTNLIADLSPAGVFCGVAYWLWSPTLMKNHYYKTFLQKTISTGSHHLSIRQDEQGNGFETDFECTPDDTIYAQLEAKRRNFTNSDHLEAAILISRSAPSDVVEMGKLRQILWRKDTWYGASNSSGAYSQ